MNVSGSLNENRSNISNFCPLSPQSTITGSIESISHLSNVTGMIKCSKWGNTLQLTAQYVNLERPINNQTPARVGIKQRRQAHPTNGIVLLELARRLVTIKTKSFDTDLTNKRDANRYLSDGVIPAGINIILTSAINTNQEFQQREIWREKQNAVAIPHLPSATETIRRVRHYQNGSYCNTWTWSVRWSRSDAGWIRGGVGWPKSFWRSTSSSICAKECWPTDTLQPNRELRSCESSRESSNVKNRNEMIRFTAHQTDTKTRIE